MSTKIYQMLKTKKTKKNIYYKKSELISTPNILKYHSVLLVH